MDTPVPGMVNLLTAALLSAVISGAAAEDLKPVAYTCADGTTLLATFSPPSLSSGTATLTFAGSTIEVVLPQAVSADGGRHTDGAVEFWIKGRDARLTRAGNATTCRTSD